MRQLDILLSGLTFPEAPRWRADRLWFSDFYSFRVMTVGLDGRDETIAEVPGRPEQAEGRGNGLVGGEFSCFAPRKQRCF